MNEEALGALKVDRLEPEIEDKPTESYRLSDNPQRNQVSHPTCSICVI